MTRAVGSRSLALLPGALLLCACAALPPATQAPPLAAAAPLDQPASGNASWPRADWWQRYGDPVLDELERRALQKSPTIAAVSARFDLAREQLRLASAARGVSLDGTLTADRQRLSDNGLLPPEFLGFHWYNQIDLGLHASYTFDWWGEKRAVITAALDRSRAAQADAALAAQELSAAVADAYLGWQADQQRIALARESLGVAEQALTVAKSRFAAGLERDTAVEHASAQRAAAAEQLAVQQGSADMRKVLLAALLGSAPADLPALVARDLPPAIGQLPADLRIGLLARRADIQASRLRVEAALQDVKAARAGFLPNISLNALATLSSVEYGKLLEYDSRAPSLGVALKLPLFNAGTLRAQHAARQAELRAAIADYDATLLGAAREVGQQVIAREQIVERTRARAEQAQAVAGLLSAARRRVQHGISDRRAELDAMQADIQQRAAMLDLRSAAISADIALIQALGGGFDS